MKSVLGVADEELPMATICLHHDAYYLHKVLVCVARAATTYLVSVAIKKLNRKK